MQKLEFLVEKSGKLIKAIIDKLPDFSRYEVEKMLDNKDIKLNLTRPKKDVEIAEGDKITVYYNNKQQREWFDIVFKDENILVVNKHAGIEVVSGSERDLLAIIKKDFPTAAAVHRLDRNTEGLVIFSLNSAAEDELALAFKTRKGIIKKYALLVHGRVDLTKIKRTVYLKKVENLSKVWISEVKTSGYEPIITEFDIIQYKGENTLLQANLITGKTHQIRAHMAYYGYPIVGDNKYGKDSENTMHLTAYSLAFNFDKKSMLKYLNKNTFEITPTWI